VAKDNWDKAEVASKFFVPVIIALAALAFNNQVSVRSQAATMAQVAVGILVEEPEEMSDELRDWAINVLQRPGEIVALDEAAAEALKREGLPGLSTLMAMAMEGDGDANWGPAVDSMRKQGPVFDNLEDCESFLSTFDTVFEFSSTYCDAHKTDN